MSYEGGFSFSCSRKGNLNNNEVVRRPVESGSCSRDGMYGKKWLRTGYMHASNGHYASKLKKHYSPFHAVWVHVEEC